MIEADCSTCKYFKDNQCRFNPPVIIYEISQSVTGYWPNVHPQSWCSKYMSFHKANSFPPFRSDLQGDVN